MGKNSQFTHAANPVVSMRREKGTLSYDRLMTANLGTLYPFYLEEVNPGDSFKVKSSVLSRVTSSFLKPAFANIFCDTYYFFVPYRLCYDKWQNIFGENTEGHWANTQQYSVPSTLVDFRASATSNNIVTGSVADYLAMPLSSFADAPSQMTPVSLLHLRAFGLIYNEWFRDENYIDPVAVCKGEANSLTDETLNNRPWSTNNYTGMLPKVSKFHDYFTSLLPAPQKGSAVDVLPNVSTLPFLPLRANGQNFADLEGYMRLNIGSSTTPLDYNLKINGGSPNVAGGRGTVYSQPLNSNSNEVYGTPVTATNLGITNPISGALTVNDLRLAIQTQRVLERDSRGGTRYVEVLKSAFGVSSPDARLQRPEFLGGKRLSIGISQVAQTSASSESGALGSLAGYSLSDGQTGFSKAFVEHGCIIGVLCYRQYHSYSQGLDERFTRFNRFDFYDPALAHLGEVPVKKQVLYAGANKDDVLGYAPVWSSYRYHNNEICGQMRSQALNSLDMWHLGDEYSNAPTMNAQFREETPNYLDRALSVSSSVQDQFLLNIYHTVETVRVMPSHSTPGLMDHY